MKIKQLSVFLENKPGRLCAACDALANHGIDISALSLADTTEFGIVRLIVNDPDKAKSILFDVGVIGKITDVTAVAMEDIPGGTVGILHLFASNNLNIEYMYAFTGKISGKALMIIRTDDIELAEKVLSEKGYNSVSPADIYRI